MYVILLLLLLGVVFGPQLWAQSILRRHSRSRADLPGTGGELARHLLDRFDLGEVKVEQTTLGDHYDPQDKVVRLRPERHDGRSLSAVVVASHEVGHALQDHFGYQPLQVRTRLVRYAAAAEKIGSMLMMGIPVVTLITRAPGAGLLTFVVGVLTLGIATVVHLVTLPVEFDASFRRALPILETGYVAREDMRAARRILTACALTYVAGSLASLLNLWRWIMILRR